MGDNIPESLISLILRSVFFTVCVMPTNNLEYSEHYEQEITRLFFFVICSYTITKRLRNMKQCSLYQGQQGDMKLHE